MNYTPDGVFVFGVQGDYSPDGVFLFTDSLYVQRFVTASACSKTNTATKSINTTQLSTQKSANLNLNNFIKKNNATELPIYCFAETNKSIKTESDFALQLNNSQLFDTLMCAINQQMTKVYPDRFCSKSEATKALITKNILSVIQQMTKVYPDKICSILQDSSQRQLDFFVSKILDPLAPGNYTPNGDFIFTEKEYTANGQYLFNFGEEGLFADSHIFGVLSNSNCSSNTQATFFEKRACIETQKAIQAPPGSTIKIDPPRLPVNPGPPSGETIIIPRQDSYTMIRTTTVTLIDGTPIDLSNINLSDDADSYAWEFSAELVNPAQIDLIKQEEDGTAIKLVITLNGYIWHVLVEKIKTNRRFGQEQTNISGRGLTALLSKPYQQLNSLNHGDDANVSQLIDLILPPGWNELGDLYWQLGESPIASPVNWLVNGGAYSYTNKTPIEAVNELITEIGAMIIPSPDSQEIYFKSRYPIAPWLFDLINVDIAIPDDAILEYSEEPVSSWQANGVYVHGNEIGGELAFVRLNGTAGDRLAPTVNNNLMTDVVALRHLGQRILSSQYAQPKIKSITTFMDGEIMPLIKKGDFVGLTVDDVETRGIVNAVSISDTGDAIEQTITIGESTPNSWVAFKEILPKDPMFVATLANTDQSTSLMSMIDGGVVRVRGTGTVGAKYYIRSGEIISKAPNLVLNEIVI